jgi:serine/threonine-protein kinase
MDYLVIEFIPGITLSTKLSAGPLSDQELLRLGIQLVQGLAAAHAQGVLHRDLKPGNLRIRSDGQLKILDFGLAKLINPVSHDLTTASLVETHTLAGTLPYMAPEQLRGESSDARTDIYSAGVVFYEMATGKRPFQGELSSQLIDSVLHRSPPPVTGRHSPYLEHVIVKCLQKDPAQRYMSASDLLADLGAIQSGAPTQIHPVGRGIKRYAIAVLAILFTLIALLAIPALRQHLQNWFANPPMPSERLVAVLPFTVLGGSTQSTPFSDGLTETLTTKLTQLSVQPSLQVVPARELRVKEIKVLDQARNEFGATTVIEGSLHQSGDNLRVNIALADTRTRSQVRARSFTVPMSDPFVVQDEIVNAVVEMLQLEIDSAQRRVLEAHGTQVASAYDLYLQGRGYLQNYDKLENVQSAIQAFDRALKLDPNYALAYAALGDAYWQMYESTNDARWVDESQRDCKQALKLDSRLPAALVCLGNLYEGTGRYQEAVAEFERAIENEPTNDQAYMELAETYAHLGSSSQAEATYRRAIDLRPHYWAGYNWLGVFYYRRARYREAAEMFEKVVSIAPDNARGCFNLATAYTALGRYSDAIELLNRSLAARPTATAYTDLGNAYFYLRRFDDAADAYEKATRLDSEDPLLWWNLGDGYYWTPGKRAQAASAYQHAISVATTNLRVNPKDAYSLGIRAICYAMLNEKKQALASLQEGLKLSPADPEMLFKAALVHNQFGNMPQTLNWLEKALSVGFSPTTVRDTPNFDHLHNDPRFQKLLRTN